MSMLTDLAAARVASRIWQRDTSVFAPAAASDAVRNAIRNRLGWLDAPDSMRAELPRVCAIADRVRADGITAACLLGMGGSSLCAEVLRDASAPGQDGLSLTVLDTTDEQTIVHLSDAIDPARTLFLVASKSGTTIEVSSLERHFGSLAARALGARAGAQFVAITDPGTTLDANARTHGYRDVLINPADIGGRYSALSLFGLLPAALLGLDVDALLGAGRAMAARCRVDDDSNPGLALGSFMSACAAAGRDKLTVLLPAELAALGPWIEQLVAESTGKEGRGVLPVVDEPLGTASEYRNDRAFVLVQTSRAADADLDRTASALEAAGHPVFSIAATEGLGAEFFRWEFATAVAGAALGINPFDEPNVRQAKTHTQSFIESFRSAGALIVDPPLKPVEGVPGALVRESRAAQSSGLEGRYVALLDYLPPNPARQGPINELRRALRQRTGCATTHGIGPRYLHSTGQYHKGGPNTGIFVLLTAADRTITAVPGTDYSFSVLKQAQALGDFAALTAAGRDVLHLHFEAAESGVAPVIEQALASFLG